MNKTEAKFQIQVLSNWGYETLCYTDGVMWKHLLSDLKQCRPNEKFRVITNRLKVVHADIPEHGDQS
jgi:hypothetical protein